MTAGDDEIATVRRAFEAFEVSADRLEEYFGRFFTPDGVVEFVDGFPLQGRYEGVEGFRRWFEESYGPYEDVKRRLDSITAEGDLVVALLTVTGRPAGESDELLVQMGNTYELEDGRIKHLRVYVGHERTLEAARGDSQPRSEDA
jgi:ketosteroid isomerase-like protein